MTVATPPKGGNPPDGQSCSVAVVKLIDRALGSGLRFRRLLVLLATVLLVAAAIALLATQAALPLGYVVIHRR